jgi:hypothetical protein
MSAPSDVTKAIEAQTMMAAASCAFNAGVVGVGKPLTVAQPQAQVEKENPKPKMRTGPTVGPRKAAKVSDIF